MTYSKEDIFHHVTEILQDQFDIAPDSVRPEARLREDLDIDSIDAVNLIIELKSLTGRKLPLDNLQTVLTIGDVVDAVHQFLGQEDNAAD